MPSYPIIHAYPNMSNNSDDSRKTSSEVGFEGSNEQEAASHQGNKDRGASTHDLLSGMELILTRLFWQCSEIRNYTARDGFGSSYAFVEPNWAHTRSGDERRGYHRLRHISPQPKKLTDTQRTKFIYHHNKSSIVPRPGWNCWRGAMMKMRSSLPILRNHVWLLIQNLEDPVTTAAIVDTRSTSAANVEMGSLSQKFRNGRRQSHASPAKSRDTSVRLAQTTKQIHLGRTWTSAIGISWKVLCQRRLVSQFHFYSTVCSISF